jgi:hypothetical protein
MSLPRVAFGVLVQRGTVVAEDFSVAPALVVDTAVTVVLMVAVDACPVVFVGIGVVPFRPVSYVGIRVVPVCPLPTAPPFVDSPGF